MQAKGCPTRSEGEAGFSTGCVDRASGVRVRRCCSRLLDRLRTAHLQTQPEYGDHAQSGIHVGFHFHAVVISEVDTPREKLEILKSSSLGPEIQIVRSYPAALINVRRKNGEERMVNASEKAAVS